MRILVFGDSISGGAFDDESGGWVGRLASSEYKKFTSGDWCTVIDASVSGDTSTDMLNRIESEVRARMWPNEKHVVVLAVGLNDTYFHKGIIKTELETFSQNISKCIDIANALVNRVLILGLTPIDDLQTQPIYWDSDLVWKKDTTQEYEDVLKQISDDKSTTYISLGGLFGDTPEIFLPDGLHPNAEGHRLIFERVKSVLEEEGVL